jgi:hypothetical protein
MDDGAVINDNSNNNIPSLYASVLAQITVQYDMMRKEGKK